MAAPVRLHDSRLQVLLTYSFLVGATGQTSLHTWFYALMFVVRRSLPLPCGHFGDSERDLRLGPFTCVVPRLGARFRVWDRLVLCVRW